MPSPKRALVRLLLAFVLALATLGASPLAARACACGAAPGAEVNGEQALITFDGTTEQIDLVMQLSSETTKAGWIMPAPKGTKLAVGQASTIRRLHAATAPVQKTRKSWRPRLPSSRINQASGGAPTGASTVSVTVTDVGDFRVSTLSADDASAVNDWLTEHGFPTADDQVPTFQKYLDQGWNIQAVALNPRSGTFSTNLPPLRMTFETREIVYPIELSRHASARQGVRLFVAAPYQVKVEHEAAEQTPLRLIFAGTVDPDVVGRSTGFGGGQVHLTAFEANLDPEQITGDYTFVQTADQPYQRVIWHTDETPGMIIGGLLLAAVPMAVTVGVVVFLLRFNRRRRA